MTVLVLRAMSTATGGTFAFMLATMDEELRENAFGIQSNFIYQYKINILYKNIIHEGMVYVLAEVVLTHK